MTYKDTNLVPWGPTKEYIDNAISSVPGGDTSGLSEELEEHIADTSVHLEEGEKEVIEYVVQNKDVVSESIIAADGGNVKITYFAVNKNKYSAGKLRSLAVQGRSGSDYLSAEAYMQVQTSADAVTWTHYATSTNTARDIARQDNIWLFDSDDILSEHVRVFLTYDADGTFDDKQDFGARSTTLEDTDSVSGVCGTVYYAALPNCTITTLKEGFANKVDSEVHISNDNLHLSDSDKLTLASLTESATLETVPGVTGSNHNYCCAVIDSRHVPDGPIYSIEMKFRTSGTYSTEGVYMGIQYSEDGTSWEDLAMSTNLQSEIADSSGIWLFNGQHTLGRHLRVYFVTSLELTIEDSTRVGGQVTTVSDSDDISYVQSTYTSASESYLAHLTFKVTSVTYADRTDAEDHYADTTVHVTQEEKDVWNNAGSTYVPDYVTDAYTIGNALSCSESAIRCIADRFITYNIYTEGRIHSHAISTCLAGDVNAVTTLGDALINAGYLNDEEHGTFTFEEISEDCPWCTVYPGQELVAVVSGSRTSYSVPRLVPDCCAGSHYAGYVGFEFIYIIKNTISNSITVDYSKWAETPAGIPADAPTTLESHRSLIFKGYIASRSAAPNSSRALMTYLGLGYAN